jgi:tetratricopeptide (TPR) repeat protein
MSDELSGADRSSRPPSFDFDDDAIASLLDTFVATRTGASPQASSHPPDPNDAGAQAAHRTVFHHAADHETLPLVGEAPEVKRRRIELLRALAANAVGSARSRLLTAQAELHEHLGELSRAEECYAAAAESDARDVFVLRAVRRHALRRADWASAARALEKEAALELAVPERVAALTFLAQIQLCKLGDAAAAEQAATRATRLDEKSFVAWIIAAGARLARGQLAHGAEAVVRAAATWPDPGAQAALLMHAAELEERAGLSQDARVRFQRVLELRPDSVAARLGIVRRSVELGEPQAAAKMLKEVAEGASSSARDAVRRMAAVYMSLAGRKDQAAALLRESGDRASRWTLAELAALREDLQAARDAFNPADRGAASAPDAVERVRRDRFSAELGERSSTTEPAPSALAAFAGSLEALVGSNEEMTVEGTAALFEIEGAASRMARADEIALRSDRQSFLAALETELAQAQAVSPEGRSAALAEASSFTIDVFASNAEMAADEAMLDEPSEDERERAYQGLRATLEDADAPVEAARAALDSDRPDPLLIEHLVHTVGPDTERAGDLMSTAAHDLGDEAYRLRAAVSYAAAGLPARSARLLRELNPSDDPDLRVRRQDAELWAGEFARLADAAMQRARSATDATEECRALAAMAEVDRLARRDMPSARLALQSIAEQRPDHVPTSRALEWDALRAQDPERIRSSVKRLLQVLPQGASERIARRRLIVELLQSEPGVLQKEIDGLLLEIDEPVDADPGLARRRLGAAYAKRSTEIAIDSLVALQASLGSDLQRAALALDASELLRRAKEPGRALEALNTAADHPLALETEAQLLKDAKRWNDAAAAFQEAAQCSKNRTRAASLLREAACIFEEALGDRDRATAVLEAAASADIAYRDVYRRLAALYREADRTDHLGALIDARVDAGADTPTLVAVLLDKAAHRRMQGDLDGVIDALEDCLDLDPFHFAALRELVDAHRTHADWQGAAEALIRIARLKRSTQEEIWAFLQLGEIYYEHLGDLSRAEASLGRALELAPNHLEAMDRMASVLADAQRPREAARFLQVLVRRAAGYEERRDHRIRLAAAVEQAGETRQAEAQLEQLRMEHPTDPDVIFAMADYYARQGADPAESMHLNRAANDLREAIEHSPEDEAAWVTLVRVLGRRLGPKAASCAVSAAIAVGHSPSLFEGEATADHRALGQPKLPLSAAVDRGLAPSALPQAVRRLFALCEQAFDKLLPFDAGAWRLRRPSAEHRPLVEEAGVVAQALGLSEPKLRVTYVAPRACMPISGDPPTLVVGGHLHELMTADERTFLFARALKVAGAHLVPALRVKPEELDTALLALLQGHDPSRTEQSAALEGLRRKLVKAVPRRWRDEVESLVLELRGHPTFSTRLVPFAVSSLGDRVALTLTGNVPAAVDALLKIAGHDVPRGSSSRLGAIRETPEAWSLVRFAISDAHFEARAQAGVDR